MEIRNLTESDIPAVLEIIEQTDKLPSERPSIHWLFSKFFFSTSFVAISGSKLMGFIYGFVNQSDLTEAYIYSLGVASHGQRQGIGSALMAHFSEVVNGLGVRRLYLTTTPDNHSALAFYKALGFEEPCRISKVGQPRWGLQKIL